MGADAALTLHTWKEVQRLPALARIAVVSRPGCSLDAIRRALGRLGFREGQEWVFISAKTPNVSSTAIREAHLWTMSAEQHRHVMRVVRVADRLAARFGVDRRKACLAAVLHDCGKFSSDRVQKRLLAKFGVRLDRWERQDPRLWHAPLGAALAKQVYGVKDRAVLQAIRRHTTAEVGMTPLDMVIYLADGLEPGRRFPGIQGVRRLARRSLPVAFRQALRLKIRHVLEEGRPVHPRALFAWNWIARQTIR